MIVVDLMVILHKLFDELISIRDDGVIRSSPLYHSIVGGGFPRTLAVNFNWFPMDETRKEKNFYLLDMGIV